MNIYLLLWRRDSWFFFFCLWIICINSRSGPQSKESIIDLLCGWEGELFLCVLLIRVTLSNCAVMHIKKKKKRSLLQAVRLPCDVEVMLCLASSISAGSCVSIHPHKLAVLRQGRNSLCAGMKSDLNVLYHAVHNQPFKTSFSYNN